MGPMQTSKRGIDPTQGTFVWWSAKTFRVEMPTEMVLTPATLQISEGPNTPANAKPLRDGGISERSGLGSAVAAILTPN